MATERQHDPLQGCGLMVLAGVVVLLLGLVVGAVSWLVR